MLNLPQKVGRCPMFGALGVISVNFIVVTAGL